MDKGHFCQINVKPLHSRSKPNPHLARKVSARIRDFTTIFKDYPLRKFYFRSSKSYQDEKIRHIRGAFWFSVHPFSKFQFYRNYIMAFMYVTIVILDLIDIAHLENDSPDFNGFKGLLIFANMVALFDCICNFFTGFISHTERVNINLATGTGYYKTTQIVTELDMRNIARKYIKTFFIVDILALTNLLHFCTPLFNEQVALYYLYACFRHIRIIRFITVSKNIKIILANNRLQQDLFLIIRFVFWFFFLSIFIGTMLIYVPNITSYVFNEDRRTYVQKLERRYRSVNKTLSEAVLFAQSTYDAFCLLITFQTQETEKTVEIYSIIIITMIAGNFLKIAVFLAFHSIFKRKYESRLKFQSFMTEVKYCVKNKHLNKQLTLDVINYFEVKLKKEYFNEKEILNTLQRHMQYEIFVQSSMGLIRNCHLFRNLPNYFVVQLSLRLRGETYIPGVTVINVGEIATCMYFIATGTVAVYSADGTELCHLSDGEYVGEIGILQSTARVADIVTIEHCELYRLDIKDFQEVIKPNSKFYKRIYKIAMQRMDAHNVNVETTEKK